MTRSVLLARLLRAAAMAALALAAALVAPGGVSAAAREVAPEDASVRIASRPESRPSSAASEAVPAGEESLREVLAASPSWKRSDRQPDAALIAELRRVTPGWSVEVAFGHWCSDSAREVPRFIALLDALKEGAPEVRWVAVDRQKREPASDVRRLEIARLPTFVVMRGGRELGRLVERAEPSLEARLLAILRPAPPSGSAPAALPPPAGGPAGSPPAP